MIANLADTNPDVPEGPQVRSVMMRKWALIFIGVPLFLFSVIAASSPQDDVPTAQQLKDSYAAHEGEFDFLLGSWSLSAIFKQTGKKVQGAWDGVRLADGGYILDEIRAFDAAGTVTFSATALRSYDATQGHWQVVTINVGNGLEQHGVGVFSHGEMIVEQSLDASTPQAPLMRFHYRDIRQDEFSYSADRSTDGGATWTLDFLKGEARRIGAPRTFNIVKSL